MAPTMIRRSAFASRGQSILFVAPLVLTLAWVGREKGFYLGDPIYPTDFLYARQIVELLPLMRVERPIVAVAYVDTLTPPSAPTSHGARLDPTPPPACDTFRRSPRSR